MPEVCVLTDTPDVMQVAHHYFENGVAFFTRRINKCITMACANGEVAPFVGHNAFLRWQALQDAAFVDSADGKQKIWSESNVSEDFDMALRLQLRGYIIRYVVSALHSEIALVLTLTSCPDGRRTLKVALRKVCRLRLTTNSTGGRSTPTDVASKRAAYLEPHGYTLLLQQAVVQPACAMVAQRTYQSPNPQIYVVNCSDTLQNLHDGLWVYQFPSRELS